MMCVLMRRVPSGIIRPYGNDTEETWTRTIRSNMTHASRANRVSRPRRRVPFPTRPGHPSASSTTPSSSYTPISCATVVVTRPVQSLQALGTAQSRRGLDVRLLLWGMRSVYILPQRAASFVNGCLRLIRQQLTTWITQRLANPSRVCVLDSLASMIGAANAFWKDLTAH